MENIKFPSISVLVLNYNGRKFLSACFESLRKQTYPKFQIYLIDNGSIDESIAFTRSNFPEIGIISFAKNIGFAEAYNRAVAQIHDFYVVFLNNDTRCQPDWLIKLYEPMMKNPRIAATGSRMVFANQPELINHGGGYFTYTGIGLDKDFGKNINDTDIEQHPFVTAYACGGAMLIKKIIFQQVGGFDSEYFIYFEDVDLAYRLWLKGYIIMHVPASVVFHFFSPVFGKESPAKLFLCQKNRLSNIIKHFQLQTLIFSKVISFGYDSNRIVKWIVKGSWQQIWSVFAGFLAFLSNLPRLFYQRRYIQKNRVRSDKWLKQKGLFLSLSKSFSELERLNLVKEKIFGAFYYKEK